jgi:hypothetical protein
MRLLLCCAMVVGLLSDGHVHRVGPGEPPASP